MADDPPPLIVATTNRYERDVKRLQKRGAQMSRLVGVVDALRRRQPLDPRHRDHALKGDWKGWRDCHVESDWVLVYRIDKEAGQLLLGRTGSHADLFE